MEFLLASSNSLSAALDQYLAACSAIASCYDAGKPVGDISRAAIDRMADEVQRVNSYSRNINQAQTTIRQTRNAITTPIYVLPPEIITRIFQLVLDAQPCYFEDQSQYFLTSFPLGYPEVLSHVCSRWRRIAINSHLLWSHVDVVPFKTAGILSGRRILARAEVFAARAGHSPLHIHIAGRTKTSYDQNSSDIDPNLNRFCASVAPRTKSLDLSTYHTFQRLHSSVLQNFLTNCVPGSLHQLTLASNTGSRIDYSDYPYTVNLFVDEQCYSECSLSVKVLRLTGIYFPWTHGVYSELVELHLLPGCPSRYSDSDFRITRSQLIGILKVSPKLRILHFGLYFDDSTPHENTHMHANLDDLEELCLRSMPYEFYEAFLALLSPGPKPLRISLAFGYHDPGILSVLSSHEVEGFFARSNVTQLYIECSGSTWLPSLLRSLQTPGLRVLILADCRLRTDPYPSDDESESSSDIGGHDNSPPAFSQLDVLHFVYGTINMEGLQEVAEILPIQTLKLGTCLVQDEEGDRQRLEDVWDKWGKELAEIFPVAQFVHAPYPLSNWDPWSGSDE